MKEGIKKILSREFRILFSIVGITILLIGILVTRDYYYLFLAKKYDAQHRVIREALDNETKDIHEFDSLQIVKSTLEMKLRAVRDNGVSSRNRSHFLGTLIGFALLIAYPIRGIYFLLKWVMEILKK